MTKDPTFQELRHLKILENLRREAGCVLNDGSPRYETFVPFKPLFFAW